MPVSQDPKAPVMCAECPIACHALYKRAWAAGADSISALRMERRGIEAGHNLLRQGERHPFIYTLYGGWAYKQRILADGGRHVIAFYIPGDAVNLCALSHEPSIGTVKALTDIEVCAFDAEQYGAFFTGQSELQADLIGELGRRWRAAHLGSVEIARSPAEQRVLYFFSVLGARLASRGLTGDDGSFEVPIPQTVLADALALTPVYLNRVLVGLRDAGALEISRKLLRVRSIDRVNALRDSGEIPLAAVG